MLRPPRLKITGLRYKPSYYKCRSFMFISISFCFPELWLPLQHQIIINTRLQSGRKVNIIAPPQSLANRGELRKQLKLLLWITHVHEVLYASFSHTHARTSTRYTCFIMENPNVVFSVLAVQEEKNESTFAILHNSYEV